MPCKYAWMAPTFLMVLIHFLVLHPYIRPIFNKAWPYYLALNELIKKSFRSNQNSSNPAKSLQK